MDLCKFRHENPVKVDMGMFIHLHMEGLEGSVCGDAGSAASLEEFARLEGNNRNELCPDCLAAFDEISQS